MLHSYQTRSVTKLHSAYVNLERIQVAKFDLYPSHHDDESSNDSLAVSSSITLTQLVDELVTDKILTPPIDPTWPIAPRAPTPSRSPSPYNWHQLTEQDIDKWYDLGLDSEDDPQLEDDVEAELVALMQSQQRATTPELLGDSPLVPHISPYLVGLNQYVECDHESDPSYFNEHPTNLWAPMLTPSPDYRPTTPVEDLTDVWPAHVSRDQHRHLPFKKAYLRCLNINDNNQ